MGSKKSSTTSRTDLPDFVTDAGRQATEMGRAIAGREYNPYYGQRVANLSGNERQAMNLAAGGNGRAQQLVDYGTDLLAAGKSWEDATDTEKKAYEEPIFQAVTRPALDSANSSYDRQRKNLSANMDLIEAKGGSDAVNLSGMSLDRNLNEATTDITARGRQQAFDAAQQQWGSDQARQQATAQAYIAAGGDLARMNSDQIRDLLMTGGAERVLRQKNLDFDYQQFLENRDWDVTNLGPLLAALRGTSGAYDYDEVNSSRQPGGGLGQLLGLATTLSGAYFGRQGGGGGATGMGANIGGNYSDVLTNGVVA